jgi:hypothetical protein
VSSRLEAALAAIDAANESDPTSIMVRGQLLPLAFAHGRLASGWVIRLVDESVAADPMAPLDEALVIAARAHHLRRWEVPRTDYPEGRPGYLRWRKDQKARHARDVEAILEPLGYLANEIERTQALIRRDGLGSDRGAQLLEDAACLVFIETQLTEMVDRFERGHYLDVIRKTARKMSADGLRMVAELPLDDTARQLLADAFAES